MNKGRIHTEVLCDIKYLKNVNTKDHIFELIDKVEKINSYCVGGDGCYVLSSYKKGVLENDLVKIIMEHVYNNIKDIKEFKIRIWKYDKKGNRIRK